MKGAPESGRPKRAGRPRAREAPVGIKAIDQALDVVDALARSDRPMSLTELSGATGMEPSKLHRYLVSLRARGLIQQIERDGAYDLGPGALALGVVSLSRLNDFDVLRDAADRLSAQFGQSSFLYVWTQTGPVLVHTRQPPYTLVSLRIGSIVPLLNSATGPVFLAYLPEALTRPILLRDSTDEGTSFEQAQARMETEIGPRIRADEVFWSETTILPNSAACAAPVFNAQGDLIAVLGASVYHRGRRVPPHDAVVAAVREAGRRVSRALGYLPGHASRRRARTPD